MWIQRLTYLLLNNWFNELSSCDEMSEADDESDNEEIDTTQNSDHESESEQDISENENVSDVQNNKFYLGKDKTTKWKKNKPNIQIRVRSHNIITHLPGPKQNARNARFEIDLKLSLHF